MTPITTDMKSFTYNSVSYVVVEVPKESFDFNIFLLNGVRYLDYREFDGYKSIKIEPNKRWEILGEITRNEQYGYKEPHWIQSITNVLPDEFIEVAKQIESHTGILLLNPMGNEPPKYDTSTGDGTYEFLDWKKYEKQLLGKDKKLIVLRQKK